MVMRLLILALVLAPVSALKTGTSLQATANPIRKVVTLMQNMQKKVIAEGEKEEALFEKYMCYCKNSDEMFGKAIEDAQTKIPDLESAVEELSGKKSQMESDIKDHKSDQAAAKKAMADATSIREKDAKAFAAESAEDKANIEAMGKAVKAIGGSASAAFLQSGYAATIKQLVQDNKDMSPDDQQTVLSFLSGEQGDSEDESTGSEVVGIIKQLMEETQKELDDATATEEKAITDYDGLMADKKKEIEALQKMVEEKLQRVGELAVEIQETKNELDDTQDALKEDSKMFAELKKNCGTKQAEHEERGKVRAQELLALADTIKLLNSDEALELFKKTLPSASSFMQIQVTAESMKARVMSMLKEMRHKSKHRPDLDFIALALRGKKVGFDKVIKMIDEYIVTLKEEGKADEEEKAYCEKEFDTADDKKKEFVRAISDIETSIDKGKDALTTTETEIEAVSDGIRALDKQVSEATEQRQEENEDFKALVAGNTAAKDLLTMAKARLEKFYKGSAALLQTSTETETSSSDQHHDSGGVIGMIDEIIKEIELEMTTAEAEEKNAQEDYETFMADSKDKRSEDTKMLEEKEAAKADLETKLGEDHAAKKSAEKELTNVEQYILSLHAKCDFILQYFEERKTARASEMDALGKAKDVLNGADYSF
eukprot:gnl/TRDRNA2_/TRDRNA2_176069_c26_seq4.p1 gnl/TRDRNA2_/TRDRNA2_176069_c26~~gnl/TRDRNA2_/TRDRNA2_176069_c26_seq4.p1  ORF type:complete len:659 (+),score=257.66 gnl/TRDRNA2_/TRDRNA2_176069_c26_seq4:98-2074(+)